MLDLLLPDSPTRISVAEQREALSDTSDEDE